MDEQNKDRYKRLRESAGAYAAGWFMVASVAGGAGLGYLLDRWLHTSPYLLALCFTLGVIGGFVEVFRIVKRYGGS